MDLEQRLRASLVAPDPGPMFTARVMARLGRAGARWRSSLILVGAVLAVGAAASILAWRLRDAQALPTDSAMIPAASDSAAGADAPIVQAIAEPEPPAIAEPEAPQVTSPGFSVRVVPLQEPALDTSRRRPVEALHAAMLDELRKIPGLTLRVSAGSGRETAAQTDYVLSVTSLTTAASRSGGVTFSSSDERNTYTVSPGSIDIDYGNQDAATNVAAAAYGSRSMAGVVSQVVNNRLARVDIEYGLKDIIDGGGANFFSSGWGSTSSVSRDGGVVSFNAGDFADPETVVWVEIKVTPRQSAASRYTFPVGAEGVGQRRCNRQGGVLPPECMTPAQLAAAQVAMLRLQVFPPDAAFQQRVMARLGDASHGARVLQDLLPLLTGDGGSRLDPATIRALFRFAARQTADTRAQVWRTLAPVSHPALVAPLVESLLHDPDRQVRLAALANLAASYSADPLVRSTFESLDREEIDAVVRATVRRALYGPSQWRNDVLAALHATDLSYEARLAPLVAPTPDVTPLPGPRSAVLLEEQVLRPLVTLIREHLRDADHALLTAEVLRVLGNVDDPAISGLFTQFMGETSLPLPVSTAIGNWAGNHQHDPRVRENLPQIEPAIPAGLLQRMREVTDLSVLPGPRPQPER